MRNAGTQSPALEGGGFYPDYLVFWKDGTLGIYDTKSGFTAVSEETKAKGAALQEYIEKESVKQRCTGGIIEQCKDGWFLDSGQRFEW